MNRNSSPQPEPFAVEPHHLAELVDFRPDQGIIRLHEQRVVLLSAAAMGLLRKELIDTLGHRDRQAPVPAIWVCGRVSRRGQSARPIEVDHPLEGLTGRQSCLHRLEGIVRAEIVTLDHDDTTGRFHEDVLWHDSYVAEQHVHHYGKASDAGLLVAGGVRERVRQRVSRHERFTSANASAWRRARPKCTVVGKDAESWGEELEALRADFQGGSLGREVERLREAVHGASQEARSPRAAGRQARA